MKSTTFRPPQKPQSISRREREQAFRTRLILEAAEDVLVAHGFQATSVEAIAQRAEVAIGTLYKLFGSKEAIFTALVEYRQDEVLRVTEQCIQSESSPRSRLEKLVEEVFRYFDEHRGAFQIYLGATHGLPWHIRSSLGERSFAKYQRFLEIVGDLLHTGMQAGAWPADDPSRLSVAVMGIINGLLTQRHTTETPPALEDEIRQTQRLIFQLLSVSGTSPAPRRRKRS